MGVNVFGLVFLYSFRWSALRMNLREREKVARQAA